MTLATAAAERRDHYRSVKDRPSQRRICDGAPLGGVRGEIRALPAQDGAEGNKIGGCASVVESGYEMYDMFGPYTEVVSRDAFDDTLNTNNLLVEFTLNHGRTGSGLPMAHTRNDTLKLWMDEEGLQYLADVDPSRSDVADVLKALERGDLAEASFKFRIVRGQWSPDYTEFRIQEVDLNRGDVSTVNFGANPSASSSLRDATQALLEGREVDPDGLRALARAIQELSERDGDDEDHEEDDTPQPVEIDLAETHQIFE